MIINVASDIQDIEEKDINSREEESAKSYCWDYIWKVYKGEVDIPS